MKLFKLVTETSNNFEQHNLPSYASAIAFHTIISLGPLLLFSIAAASLFIFLLVHGIELPEERKDICQFHDRNKGPKAVKIIPGT